MSTSGVTNYVGKSNPTNLAWRAYGNVIVIKLTVPNAPEHMPLLQIHSPDLEQVYS